jgi:hypothetical protein
LLGLSAILVKALYIAPEDLAELFAAVLAKIYDPTIATRYEAPDEPLRLALLAD